MPARRRTGAGAPSGHAGGEGEDLERYLARGPRRLRRLRACGHGRMCASRRNGEITIVAAAAHPAGAEKMAVAHANYVGGSTIAALSATAAGQRGSDRYDNIATRSPLAYARWRFFGPPRARWECRHWDGRVGAGGGRFDEGGAYASRYRTAYRRSRELTQMQWWPLSRRAESSKPG